MKKLIRFLAVIALALSPVWGVPSHVAASGLSSPEHYPVWPSFLSTGCTAIQGPSGSTSVSCGGGSFLLSQINSGYACNEVDISISSFQQGSFLVVGTVNSGSQSNTVQIDGPGDYFMQFPGFLTNNLVTLQMTSGSTGSAMTIEGISSSTCPVSTDTPTVNPSFTPTDTAVPVTGTPTPIPTHTPLPSGHSTFTPTSTPLPGTDTATATASPTPGPAYRNCGDYTFPVLNCDFIPPSFPNTGDFWTAFSTTGFVVTCYNDPPAVAFTNFGGVNFACIQLITPRLSGDVWVQFSYLEFDNPHNRFNFDVGGSYSPGIESVTGCSYTLGGTSFCDMDTGVHVTSGIPVDFGIGTLAGGNVQSQSIIYMNNVWVGPPGGPATPVPVTDTATSTPLPGTATNTPIPTDTLVPIPGAQSTAIATSTECPGGCAVTALTAIPGLATITTVDTSPFSQLQHLSLARNGCTAFGYVQIPYPVIHGTPILGSSNPLSVTWTLPITHDWDNTNPYSNTAIEPCAMNEIPTFVWDFTYWLSVFAFSVVFIMWLIGFVGRLSGEETING